MCIETGITKLKAKSHCQKFKPGLAHGWQLGSALGSPRAHFGGKLDFEARTGN